MRYKLGKTRKPPVSIISKQAINDFRNIQYYKYFYESR